MPKNAGLKDPITGKNYKATGQPVWACSHCNKQYQTKAIAKMHERRVHNK